MLHVHVVHTTVHYVSCVIMIFYLQCIDVQQENMNKL